MAKQVLPVNFTDDLLAESMDGKRKYQMIDNGDGTISLEDVSEYLQMGSVFGAGQINSTNQAVNESVDKDKILKTLEEVSASTDSDAVVGRGAVAELNQNINKVKTYVGSDGKLHFVDASGADSVLPFSSKPIKLGTARSYNLTSYANYKNFTNASFLCECLSSSSIKTKDNNESGTYTFHGGATYTPITKSYNASTGVLTISGGTIKASIYRNNVDQGMSQTNNLTVTTWLIP